MLRKPGESKPLPWPRIAPDRLVLPRRHVLEHVEQLRRDLQAVARAAEQPKRGGEVVRAQLLRRRLDLEARELEPELRRLVHRLEEELVAVRHLLGRLLQREQLVGAQIPLVVARAGAREDRLRVVLLDAARHVPGAYFRAAMSDLFSDAARERTSAVAPLALRVRPASLDEFVGQQHVLGEGSALRLAIEQDRVGSMILYGPPGSGKTTLARIVARMTGAAFEELSAVSATVCERARGAGARARAARRARRSGRSSSSTRSTASTRRSRTRCCRRSRRRSSR